MKAMIVFIAFFMLSLTVLALITVPYNPDSMTYHLSRIMFWIQHQSVDYYDTCVMRQLFSPVFAEYINLHVFLLTGGDLFANMLQNFSAYGCIFLLYGIIRKLGCNIKYALFGCILTLSMNIFCAESLSTQVDLVGTFYLMMLTYFAVEILYQSKLTFFQFMLLGLVSGLIYITKTNACAPAAVIIIYVVLYRIFHGDFKIIPLGFVSLIFVFLIVFTTFYRNYSALNGDFIANTNIGGVVIGTSSPKYVFANVIKNLITAGFERNNELIKGGMTVLEKILKIDINAPEISFIATPFSVKYSLHMDLAGAHIVTPLFLIAAVIFPIYLIRHRTRINGLIFIMLAQMFVMLALLRWQPWGSRLLISSLVIAVIPIVYIFKEITDSFKKNSLKYKICYFLILELIFQCGICSSESFLFHSSVALNAMRSPRYARYWANSQTQRRVACDNFLRIIDEGIYNTIGLEGTYQYPFLARYVPQGKKIECVTLSGNGIEEKNLNPDFSPDIILVSDNALDSGKLYTCNGNKYKCIYSFTDDGLGAENSQIYHSAWIKDII